MQDRRVKKARRVVPPTETHLGGVVFGDGGEIDLCAYLDIPLQFVTAREHRIEGFENA